MTTLFDLTTLEPHPRATPIANVAANAERQGFDADAAAEFVVRYLAAGEAFSQDIVEAAVLAGFEPHDRRAFGAVFMGLAKAGRIVKAGYSVRGNGSPGLRWAVNRREG